MKIRTSLTLRYALVTAGVFLAFILTVCGVSEQARSTAFSRNLKSEAVTKAHLFLTNKVDASTMQSIYRNNTRFIHEVEVAVYDTTFAMLYHDAVHNDRIKETPGMLRRILREGEVEFNAAGYQGVGIRYRFGQTDYVVTAAAYDGYGHAQQRLLTRALLLLLAGGLTLLILLGFFLSRAALAPVRTVVKEVERISANRLDRRLPVKNPTDELGELSLAFNALLQRLERAYNAQKRFVGNVSHELRTPMAALRAQLDLALMRRRDAAYYQRSIHALQADAERIVKLIDNLLDLAKADYDPRQLERRPLRIDELLLDVRQMVLRAHTDYRITLVFDAESENDDVLTVTGNNHLLVTAFINLMENNCKYSSEHSSLVGISFSRSDTIVTFTDNGIGMSQRDRENIFRFFYRGENSETINGYGIGMTLAQKIIALHQGEIAVYSTPGEGTTFTVRLPRDK
ncbi:MAG: HAMP domain-containing histidine kinase [Prevotellaceae bacterium]|nr:HAMP domain-containing histidine kinase [Prevotellaceae bacterium]